MSTMRLLGGTCFLALVMAMPAAAQDSEVAPRYGNGPQYSTPAEQAQTENLNRQYTNGTDESPNALNGEAPRGTPSMQAQQYDEQRAQYDATQQDYASQQDEYAAERAQYARDLRRYDLARYEYDYPRPYSYEFENVRLRSLDRIAEPSEQLYQVPIEGPTGRYVGRVRNVQIGPNGWPSRIEVALNRRVSVLVSPGHFRYDPYNRVLFTDLTRDDLWSTPGARVMQYED